MIRLRIYKTRWISIGLLFVCLGWAPVLYGQDQRLVDSLANVISEAKHDTSIANAYVLLSETYFTSKPDTVYSLCQKALNTINQSIQKEDKNGNIRFMGIKAKALNIMGVLLVYKGDFKNALNYIDESKQIHEELGNMEGVGVAYLNTSSIFMSQGDTAKAMENIYKSLVIFRENNNQNYISQSLITLGVMHEAKGNISQALLCLKESLKIKLELDDKKGIADIYNNLGILYLGINNLDTALSLLDRALLLYKEINYKYGIGACLLNIGEIHFQKDKINLALDHAVKGLLIARKLGFLTQISDGSKLLSKIYEHKKDHSKALEHFELYLQMQDSMQNKDVQKKISNKEKKYALASKENEQQVLEKGNELKELVVQHQQETAKKQTWIMLLATGAILLLLFLSFIVYRRYNLKKRANMLIRLKNKTIEDQQHQITEGIEYARNLQRNIMVTEKEISDVLTDCLFINEPRNIVSGDFHWYKKIEDRIYISMIDCTGHGVPGALTSIIGNNLLHNIIADDSSISPGELISKLHFGIIKALKGEEGSREVNVGMEMAMCVIDKNAKSLTYAGANMPLFMLKGDIMEEVKPTNQAIGYSAFFRKARENLTFKNNTIKLEDDVSYYMTTDGFIDQFDQNDKEKFGKARFLELLARTSKQDMNSQKQEIISDLNNWKGETVQTDDVSVVGFRV